LSQVVEFGLVPLVAHPERYSCCSVGAVRQWRSLGAKTQVDATTLLASQARGQRARRNPGRRQSRRCTHCCNRRAISQGPGWIRPGGFAGEEKPRRHTCRW
jgi:hypothetical protein